MIASTEYPRHLRGLVSLGLFLDQLSLGVDGEDPAEGNAHLLIGERILRGGGKKKVKQQTKKHPKCKIRKCGGK